MPNPHDALFKAVFSRPTHASALLAHVLPRRLRRVLDLSSPELVAASLVGRDLAQRHATSSSACGRTMAKT